MKFKIKKQEYANRTFRMPVELLEELSRLAADKDISLNQLVIQCCEFAVDNIDDEDGMDELIAVPENEKSRQKSQEEYVR